MGRRICVAVGLPFACARFWRIIYDIKGGRGRKPFVLVLSEELLYH